MTQENHKNDKAEQNENDAIPDYARVVLVPVANPDTAGDLLQLAVSLAHPDEGRVIALMVTTESLEAQAESREQIEEQIEEIKADGAPLELRTENSTSIARGILDVIRESGADLVVLGLRQPKRGEVALGTVVENVIEIAPCDVLVFRAARTRKNNFKRIVIPVDDNLQSRVAMRTAIRLAKSYGTRIEAMYSGDNPRTSSQGDDLIEQMLKGSPGEEMVKRTTITASNPADGILSRTDEEDMILVGFKKRDSSEDVVFGEIPSELLNEAEGPVILVARALTHDRAGDRLSRRVLSWMRPSLTRVEQEEIVQQASVLSGSTFDYVIQILVSASISTLGLLLNSAAVIIGAMLIAPFMSPLIGLAVGVATGAVRMTWRGVMTVIVGVVLSLLVAIALGAVLPTASITTEMTSRGSPSLLDAAVALAAGVIGGYATARKDIPAAIAGVAIAAALMPPLSTVGLSIALGDNELAFGAMVLFSANIVSIVLSATLVFRYLGMNARRADQPWTWQHTVSISTFALFALGVVIALVALTRSAQAESIAIERFREAIHPLALVDVTTTDGDPLQIRATIHSAEPVTPQKVGEIEADIEAEIERDVRLEIVVLPVVTAPESTPEAVAPVSEVTPEITPEANASTP